MIRRNNDWSAAGVPTAYFLGVGAETVKTHREGVLRKLRARNATHAVALACATGVLGAETLRRVAALVEARR